MRFEGCAHGYSNMAAVTKKERVQLDLKVIHVKPLADHVKSL